MTNYDDYETAVQFEGDFQGEPIISKARIHDNGDIHIHQGAKTGDNKFRPEDIVGLSLNEMREIVEKAERVVD